MAVLKQRDWRATWTKGEREWWKAWSWGWLLLGCAIEASAEIATRESYFAEWERVGEHRNRLVRLHREHEQRADASAALLAELEREIDRLDQERLAIDRAHRVRAFDSETIKAATLRKMLEHGVSPYRIGQMANLDAESAEIDSTSEKSSAQQSRGELLDYYQRVRAARVDDYALAGRYPHCYGSVMQVAREIEKIDRLISALTPRDRKENRNR